MYNFDYTTNNDANINCNTNTSTNTNTNSLNDILNNIPFDEVSEALANYNNSVANNSFSNCELFNVLQCFSGPFFNLILLLIFLYWWNTQSIYCFLMNQNCQLTNGVGNLLEECLDRCCNGRSSRR